MVDKSTEVKKLIPERLPTPCSEADRFDAMNLIRTGNRTGDELTQRIGKARLRVLEGRETDGDRDLLHLS